ncbi:alpha/beta hydrolase [Corynebacterium matruchotii]|uniref:Alpha/beta hydrolase n=1 Tax=Corynebacterium matruchotii TaxID=43768 RepID=A0A8B4H7I8_9CORY|nr:alpha/beta hydrolase [Corynebacterium matruchotii]
MHSMSVQLPSSAGHTMAGTIDMPDTEPVAYALFAPLFYWLSVHPRGGPGE